MTAIIRVRELEQMLFGSRPGRRVMAVIQAAFDASLDENPPSGVTAIAGYIGHAEDWHEVEEKWNNLLAVWKMDTFRLTKVFRRFGDGALDVTQQFAEVVGKSGLRFVSAHMLDTDWTLLDRNSEYSQIYPERQHACLDLLLEVLAEEANLEFKGLPVAVVFDNDYGETAKSAAVYDAWCARSRYPAFFHVGYEKRSMEWDAVPLQCADMLAGLVRRNAVALEDLKGLDYRSGPRKLPPVVPVANAAMTKGRGTRWSVAIAKDLDAIIKKMRESGQ